MVGYQRVSDEQWEFLLSFMERHPEMARGTQANDEAHSKLAAYQLWQQVAASLNEVASGSPKLVSDWRNYWKRQRCDVRKKACARRSASSTMAGAPPPRHLELTGREERVLKVLGPVCVFGFESVKLPSEETLAAVDSPPRPSHPPRAPPAPTAAATRAPPAPTAPEAAPTAPEAAPTAPEAAPTAPEAAPTAPEAAAAADATRAPPASTASDDFVIVHPTFRTTSLGRPKPTRPDRNRTRRTPGPALVNRPYRRFALPPDAWSLQIAQRRLRIEADRAHYAKQLLAIEERQAKAAEKNNEIMTLILGVMTKIAQSFEKSLRA